MQRPLEEVGFAEIVIDVTGVRARAADRDKLSGPDAAAELEDVEVDSRVRGEHACLVFEVVGHAAIDGCGVDDGIDAVEISSVGNGLEQIDFGASRRAHLVATLAEHWNEPIAEEPRAAENQYSH